MRIENMYEVRVRGRVCVSVKHGTRNRLALQSIKMQNFMPVYCTNPINGCVI